MIRRLTKTAHASFPSLDAMGEEDLCQGLHLLALKLYVADLEVLSKGLEDGNRV